MFAAHRSMAGEGQPAHSPATGIVQGLLGKGNILIYPGGEDHNSKWLSFTMTDTLTPFQETMA